MDESLQFKSATRTGFKLDDETTGKHKCINLQFISKVCNGIVCPVNNETENLSPGNEEISKSKKRRLRKKQKNQSSLQLIHKRLGRKRESDNFSCPYEGSDLIQSLDAKNINCVHVPNCYTSETVTVEHPPIPGSKEDELFVHSKNKDRTDSGLNEIDSKMPGNEKGIPDAINKSKGSDGPERGKQVKAPKKGKQMETEVNPKISPKNVKSGISTSETKLETPNLDSAASISRGTKLSGNKAGQIMESFSTAKDGHVNSETKDVLEDFSKSSVNMSTPKYQTEHEEKTKGREKILAEREAKKQAKAEKKGKKAQNPENLEVVSKDKKNGTSNLSTISSTERSEVSHIEGSDGKKEAELTKVESSGKCELLYPTELKRSTHLKNSDDPIVLSSGNQTDDNKLRESILAEREARKLSKALKKGKKLESKTDLGTSPKVETGKPSLKNQIPESPNMESSHDASGPVKAFIDSEEQNVSCKKEVSGHKGALSHSKRKLEETPNLKSKLEGNVEEVNISNENNLEEKREVIADRSTQGKTKAELRAERRKMQESQRAKKEAEKQQKQAELQVKKNEVIKMEQEKVKEQTPKEKKTMNGTKPNINRVKLFSHLQYKTPPVDLQCKLEVHPAIVALGARYAARVVNGSNARCLAFLHAIKQVIAGYSTPPEKEFSRGLESQIAPAVKYLTKFRPLSVSMTNALRHVKSHITQLPNNVRDDEARTKLCDVIDTYIREQIQVAALAISKTVQRKIADGDVILTYACSSLLCQILVESKRSGTNFSVVVVDAGPSFEGREMLRRLTDHGIKCTYVLINALSFIMRKATTVLIGAHALLANGYVMSRAGSSLVALMAHSCNVPVLVCCETHKFSERVQTDAFVYNELGDPDEIVGEQSPLVDWRSWPSLSPLNLLYDITPPDLVTAVVTELAILPCTSVPVVLRVKPSDITT